MLGSQVLERMHIPLMLINSGLKTRRKEKGEKGTGGEEGNEKEKGGQGMEGERRKGEGGKVTITRVGYRPTFRKNATRRINFHNNNTLTFNLKDFPQNSQENGLALECDTSCRNRDFFEENFR